MMKGLTLVEEITPYVASIFKVRNIIMQAKTKYQNVEILDLYEFGRSLILDSILQSTEVDEYMYHESLVHSALIGHPNPKSILIIGNAEGAVLREV